MLTDWARNFFRPLVEAVARFFQRLGLTPNQLTLIGLVLQAVVALILATGHLQLGAVLLILASIFDSFDGTLARLTGQVSRFGAFFDATIDRYAEALVLGGVLVYVVQQGTAMDVYLVYAAIVGSLLVSYTRAKAESLGIGCTVGILTRAERIALLVIGLFLSDWHPISMLPDTLTLTLALLAVFSNITALQRVWEVRKATRTE